MNICGGAANRRVDVFQGIKHYCNCFSSYFLPHNFNVVNQNIADRRVYIRTSTLSAKGRKKPGISGLWSLFGATLLLCHCVRSIGDLEYHVDLRNYASAADY